MKSENLNTSVTTNIIKTIKKENNTKTLIAMISIIVIFLGLLFVTFSYFNSPKKKMIDGINKLFSTLTEKESNNKINDILKNNIVGLAGETTINLSGNLVNDTLKLFDNTVVKYNYIEDKKNNQASLDFDSSINNEKLINMYGLIKDNKLYFNLKNLINKYYYTEYYFNSLLVTQNTEDTEYVIDILKDTLVGSLDNDDFSKSKTTIKIDGEDKKVEKISFKFTDKFIFDVVSEFSKKIKEDDKALKILVKYTNLTEEEIIETLNVAIDSSKEVTTSSQDFTFNMYVKDYVNTVKYELVIDTTEIAYYDYKDTKEFSVSESGMKYLNIEVKNNKDISGTLAMMIPFKGTYEDGKLDLTLTYLTMECNLVVSTNEEYKTDSVETNSKIGLKVTESDEEYLNLVIDSKNTISKPDKINELNIQSSISVDEITESDQTTIMNKLSEMTIFKEIMNIYENINTTNNNGLEVSGIDQEITF